jgi:nucleotide-binding universal stress UspA family protein|tara:strand:+ start:1826 stop:2281 length:456 start_codon:yes stop_codon:yes gene_type:complete
MASITLLCTDGSTVSIDALRAALPLLAPADRTIVVTVESPVASDTTTGNGFRTTESGLDLTDQIETSGDRRAKHILDATVEALGLDDVELMAIVGKPGDAICKLAESLPASVVVVGTSGHGGLRRAVMGSTSDHVIRHAPCPVLVQGVGQH